MYVIFTLLKHAVCGRERTSEELLHDCVVHALLDVGVKLPGQDHHVLFHLKETRESRQSGLSRLGQIALRGAFGHTLPPRTGS